VVAIAAKLSVSFRCLALLPVTTESVMVRITGEECRSLMPAKDAGIRPVAFLKLSSNMSVNVITHLFSPPFLFLFDNDISLSMGINNTIYRYYSHISEKLLEPGKFGLSVSSCSVLSSTTEIVMPVLMGSAMEHSAGLLLAF